MRCLQADLREFFPSLLTLAAALTAAPSEAARSRGGATIYAHLFAEFEDAYHRQARVFKPFLSTFPP